MDTEKLGRCKCRCHQSALGDMRDAFLRGAYHEGFAITKRIEVNWEGIDVTSALEAAAACTGCINAHCAALLNRVEKRPKAKWVDPPVMGHPGPPMPNTDDSEDSD